MWNIKQLLKIAVEREASDLFIKADVPPYIRINGLIEPLAEEIISVSEVKKIFDELISPEQKRIFSEAKELDFILDFPGIGRFRANLFLDRQNLAFAFRNIRRKISTFSELNLPVKVLERLSFESRGLVLLTGAIGSGKSTTIASMIEYINLNLPKHILTIEEPIEFLFENKKSIISQREIGFDTSSYKEALRHAVYQSPDVIFIGTIRDADTMWAALNAAETGQLILTTLHSINAVQTVERIINFFPPYQHEEIRIQLSMLLKGVISMRLLPRQDGRGRIPVCEIMVWTPTIAALIREGKTYQIPQFIEAGSFFDMQSFHQALARLYLEKKISLEVAKNFADNPEELELFIKGIKRLDGTIG